MSIPSWRLVVLMLAGSPVQQHQNAVEKLGRDAFFNKPNCQKEMMNLIKTAEHLMATLPKASLVSQAASPPPSLLSPRFLKPAPESVYSRTIASEKEPLLPLLPMTAIPPICTAKDHVLIGVIIHSSTWMDGITKLGH